MTLKGGGEEKVGGLGAVEDRVHLDAVEILPAGGWHHDDCKRLLETNATCCCVDRQGCGLGVYFTDGGDNSKQKITAHTHMLMEHMLMCSFLN